MLFDINSKTIDSAIFKYLIVRIQSVLWIKLIIVPVKLFACFNNGVSLLQMESRQMRCYLNVSNIL